MDVNPYEPPRIPKDVTEVDGRMLFFKALPGILLWMAMGAAAGHAAWHRLDGAMIGACLSAALVVLTWRFIDRPTFN